MSPPDTDDPILVRLRRALDTVYGDKIERVVLFGSRAGRRGHRVRLRCRGFLNGLGSFNDETTRLAVIETDILFDTDAVTNAIPFGAGAYRHAPG